MQNKTLWAIYKKELKRQEESLDLIPSENIPSQEVMALVGSPLMTKYAEGYPGKRYYPGNQYYDEIERLAQTLALKAFGLDPEEWHVNVQALSGAPANTAVLLGLLNFGDTLMGMKLSAGGHLTHGHGVNFSGMAYKSVQYEVDAKTERLDYRAIGTLAKKAKPALIISGLTSYPRTIDFQKFGKIAKNVGAYHMADISHIAGLVAAGAHPSPFSYADVVTMTTHKTLRGPRGAVIFARKEKAYGAKKEKTIAELIDRAVFPGLQGGPHNNVTAAIAQMFSEVLSPAFRAYGKQIVKNAAVLARELMRHGFRLTTGGTDNHLMVVDLHSVGLDGTTAEKRLEENNILANRNSLPTDDKPFRPNGIRMGTPLLTTRGMKEREMKQVASMIARILLKNAPVKKEVLVLAKRFPIIK